MKKTNHKKSNFFPPLSLPTIFGICLFLISCGHKEVAVTEGAEQIKVAETIHELRGCESKGSFTVTKPENLASGEGLEDVILSKARLKAKDLEATHVFLKEKAVNSRAYEAFRCR